MVPTYYFQIEQMPLTPNGKINRKMLPDPSNFLFSGSREFISPKNDIEVRLTRIWSEILGIEYEKISITDNFFRIGGNSLGAINAISKIKKEFKTNITVKEVFTNVTIEGIAKDITRKMWAIQDEKINDNIKITI